MPTSRRLSRLWSRGSGAIPSELPLPPLQMRELIGDPDPAAFGAERGEVVFDGIRQKADYDFVLDFGCGCGRLARRLALAANPMPRRYLGVDLHRGMVEWARGNLTPLLPAFEFVHSDVYSAGFNPDGTADFHPLPVEDGTVSLMIAHSVFTHLLQDQIEKYIGEIARVLRPDGVVCSSFFLFDKSAFPMMQSFQNALYVNTQDPTNAVIVDRDWLLDTLLQSGLAVRYVEPPEIRGFQWRLDIRRGTEHVSLPADRAPVGSKPPPVGSGQAHLVT